MSREGVYNVEKGVDVVGRSYERRKYQNDVIFSNVKILLRGIHLGSVLSLPL